MSEPTKGNRVTTEVATRRDIPLNWDVFVTPAYLWSSATCLRARSQEWVSALDTIESLNARAVIAGHKRPGNDDSPKIIEETRQLHPRFRPRSWTTMTARELYDKMLERSIRIGRVNPGLALWLSARAAKP